MQQSHRLADDPTDASADRQRRRKDAAWEREGDAQDENQEAECDEGEEGQETARVDWRARRVGRRGAWAERTVEVLWACFSALGSDSLALAHSSISRLWLDLRSPLQPRGIQSTARAILFQRAH